MRCTVALASLGRLVPPALRCPRCTAGPRRGPAVGSCSRTCRAPWASLSLSSAPEASASVGTASTRLDQSSLEGAMSAGAPGAACSGGADQLPVAPRRDNVHCGRVWPGANPALLTQHHSGLDAVGDRGVAPGTRRLAPAAPATLRALELPVRLHHGDGVLFKKRAELCGVVKRGAERRERQERVLSPQRPRRHRRCSCSWRAQRVCCGASTLNTLMQEASEQRCTRPVRQS